MNSYLTYFLVFCLSFGSLHAEFYEYFGTARDLKTNSIVYFDYHKEEWKGDKHLNSLIQYKDPDGKVFASKKINFEKIAMIPDFTTEDTRDGFMEGGRWKGEQLELFFRRKQADPVQSKIVPFVQPSALDGGFDGFVRKNWDSLLKGDRVPLKMYVPVELDYFPFAAYKIRDSSWRGRKSVWIRMEIDQFLLKRLIAPIEIEYDIETTRLIQYKGISNINDSEGKSLKVWIEYSYPKWKNYP